MQIGRKIWVLGLVMLLVVVLGMVGCGDDDDEIESAAVDMPGSDIWEIMMEGNERFVDGDLDENDLGDSRRDELATEGQHPFAVVLTCSDSRVVPEYIFNQGLGDLFVIRNAGNVVEPVALGSIEYGVHHLDVPLLVVLGHTSCGAVTAATEGHAEGNIGEILEKIEPAVEAAHQDGAEDIVDASVDENVNLVIQNIEQESPIVKHLVEEGKLMIVGAKYHLDTGEVTLVPAAGE